MRKWDLNLEEMKVARDEARSAGHDRLFALAYDPDIPLHWRHCKDESEMNRILASREESESTTFNCAIAVVVVNPQDSDDTIAFIIASRYPRPPGGLGYFTEAL